MKTKTINLYEFNELSEAAKEKARNWWRECSVGDSFWSERILDETKEQASFMGFDVEKILWSGFYYTGDGACFIGRWNANDLNPEEVAYGWGECDSTSKIKQIAEMFEKFSKCYPELQVKISHNNHYCHEMSVDYDFYFFDQETGEEKDYPEDFSERAFKETCVDLFKWIYRQLEKEYEYQNSNECVDESILANEYSFRECGTRED